MAGNGGGSGDNVLSRSAPWLMGLGALTSAIGAYYSATAQKQQLKATALDLEFAAWTAQINARSAEQQAMLADRAGQRDVALLSMQAAQEQAATRASAAGSGVTGASQAEVAASQRIAERMNAMAITRNTAQAVTAARMEGVDQQNRARLSLVSARNARRSANAINPHVAKLLALTSTGSQQITAYAGYRSGGRS